MKKFLLSVGFVLSSIMAFGQTQEETLEWLQSKFSKEGVLQKEGEPLRYVEIVFEDCVLEVWWKTSRNNPDITSTNYIPLTNIKLSNDNHLMIDYKGIKHNYSPRYGNPLILYGSIAIFSIVDMEPNLANRILTALQHLATFCPKKQEKF